MAKSSLNKNEHEGNKSKFLEKLNKFMLKEGFENFEISKFEITSDCDIITDKYCEDRGMERKEIQKNGVWKCYCILK